MCGPSISDHQNRVSTFSNTTIEPTTGSNTFLSRSSLETWAASRGYDFTFAQELAAGVPINKKSAPPADAPMLAGVSVTALDNIDLAIELVEALVALHESPIGTVVHGDLKVIYYLHSFFFFHINFFVFHFHILCPSIVE